MNTLNLKIPFAYAEKTIQMNWHDISFAIGNRYFDNEAAIEYAKMVISDDHANENELIDLLCLSPHEISYGGLLPELVFKLAREVSAEDKERTKDKILYLLLHWLYDKKDDFAEPLTTIQVIWDDFGFPESIKHLIGYMPPKDPSKVGIDAIFDNWYEYLMQSEYRSI
jgi:hypothetical protein